MVRAVARSTIRRSGVGVVLAVAMLFSAWILLGRSDSEVASPPPTPSSTADGAITASTASGSDHEDRTSERELFAPSTNSAAEWAAQNPDDPRAATIAREIGSQPIAKWFGDWNRDVGADVATYVNEANAADAVPTLVAYNIPNRDCGQHSAGGAADFDQYDSWVSSFAAGLGTSEAIIILEPDSLALNSCAGSGRSQALGDAVDTIKDACGRCRVYLDAGHSDWIAPDEMARRLRDAGVNDADGFFTNVSNYNATNFEQAFGAEVLDALGDPDGLGQVIDTSRNGNGGNGDWCDPTGRAIGDDPTLDTGIETVDALLWIKAPGEADGCAGDSGQFLADQAFGLATD